MHSLSGDSNAPLTFVNDSVEEVQIFFITIGGARDFYDSLEPNRSYSVNTYTGRVWLITDNQFNCLDYFYVSGSGGEIVVNN